MAQLPIPSDWNGQDWCCWIVEWPDSPEWRRLFSGLILDMSRGRTWNRATGTITEAQAVGKQIQVRNYIFDPECE